MIVKNNALLFTADAPDAITSVIPTARHIRHKGHDLVVVRHSLEATKILRNMGMNAPSPLEYDFDWPGRFTPMQHQRLTADFLTVNIKAFLLSTMGVGKTSAALWAAEYLLRHAYIKRILVICPLSVIKVWQDECFNLIPHRGVGVMVGPKKKRLDVLSSSAQLCVINFDGLTSLYREDKSGKKHSELEDQFDLIIVDEAATYRSFDTNRYKALKFLNKPTTRLWLLTGTPTPNAPTDAWALCRLVAPHRVPNSFKVFQETVMRQFGPYKWVAKPNAQEVVREVMQPAIRFEKKDCFDLPPITYNDRHCEMSDEQKRMFEELRRRMKHEAESGEVISASNAAVKLVKLQQVCCGVVKDDDQNAVHLDAKGRLDLLDELVAECEEKVIIFVPFIYSMELVKRHLEKKYACALVNGSVPNHERAAIFTSFQTQETPRVLIAHPKVAAHGLTLTAASTIIWYAPIYSLEDYLQANARIERKGQQNAMSIFHIGAHPMEWAIYNVLRNKGSVQSALLDLYRQEVA